MVNTVKMNRLIKKTFTTILFVSIFSYIFAQEKLSSYNTSWSVVIPGNVICEPAITSYGFAIATDAKNLMGYTDKGTLLWEKQAGKSKNVSISSIPGDFILFLEDNTEMKLFNPSGTAVWSKKLDFLPIGHPLAGKDGRFFLNSKNKIVCYSITGLCKWEIETPEQKAISLQELPDGSVVTFLDENKNNTITKGLRISPYGEYLEEITFSGTVKKSYTCNNGILLIFEDGNAGLFSLEDGFSKNRWVISRKSTSGDFVVSEDGSKFLYTDAAEDGVNVYKISENGDIENSIKIKGINGKKIIESTYTESGLFICDENIACLYNPGGNLLWSAKMPDSKHGKPTFDYLSYIGSNHIVFCNKNWSVNSYLINQTGKNLDSKNKTLSSAKQKNKNGIIYSDFVKIDTNEFGFYFGDTFYNELTSFSRIEMLKNGHYAEKEMEYLSQIMSVCKLYSLDISSSDSGAKKQKSIFQKDESGLNSILVQLSLFNNDDTQKIAADIIKKSDNVTYCRSILKNQSGYDPDANLLDALEIRAQKIKPQEEPFIKDVCNTVFLICKFMGRPAYNTKGKAILKRFMNSSYNFSTRNYASDTMKRIMTLGL